MSKVKGGNFWTYFFRKLFTDYFFDFQGVKSKYG